MFNAAVCAMIIASMAVKRTTVLQNEYRSIIAIAIEVGSMEGRVLAMTIGKVDNDD
jgi:hypothetical protein